MAVEFITGDQTSTYNVGNGDEVFLTANAEMQVSGNAFALESNGDGFVNGTYALFLAGDIYTGNDLFAGSFFANASSSDEVHLSITIGATSNVYAFGDGIVLSATDPDLSEAIVAVTNHGNVTVGEAFYFGSGADVLDFTNTGTISQINGFSSSANQALIDEIGVLGDNRIFNSGTMTAAAESRVIDVTLSSGSTLDIVNTGTMNANIGTAIEIDGFATAATNIVNAGEIFGDITSSAITTIRNSGDIHGHVSLNAPAENALENAGLIMGDVTFSNSAGTLTNTGDIFGDIDLKNGDNVMSNLGRIIGDVIGGDNDDTFLNTGVVEGDLDLGGGTNTYTSLHGGIVTGTVFGNASFELFSGSVFSDRFSSNGGDDELDGKEGDDVLDGGADNDTLRGGEGFDEMTGGTGADVFVFDLATDADTITDFGDGADQIDLTEFFGTVDFFQLFLTGAGTKGQDLLLGTGANFGNADSARVSATAEQIGDDTVLTISSASSVLGRGDLGLDIVLTLEDVMANALTVDDFIF